MCLFERLQATINAVLPSEVGKSNSAPSDKSI
jgi:hypothetical protein